MSYIAHKYGSREQTVREHCNNVAEMAEGFCIEPLKDMAYTAGLLHDVGKYSASFQERIRGADVVVEHAVCGAKELGTKGGKAASNDKAELLLQYIVAGHHTGLPDGGTAVDLPQGKTLQSRLKNACEDYSKYKAELTIPKVSGQELFKLMADGAEAGAKPKKQLSDCVEAYAFFTRYLFSCLTDSDCLDTSTFAEPRQVRGMTGDFEGALKLLNARLAAFKADTPVRKARKALQEQAFANAESLEHVNFLNMPTGSGKTLCSLKIALETAVREGKKRIIYVIPFTSIIEQTVREFEGIFGETLPVLQHHSNYFYDRGTGEDVTAEKRLENENTERKLRRTCENWDAPLIVTTSVQFFQSVYHYKGSGLRKMHNLADAVIVFDEVHLMPLKHIQPCLRAVSYITKYLNSKAIFLSATMPDYVGMYSGYLLCNTKALITDKSAFPLFRNCRYVNMNKVGCEYVDKVGYDRVVEQAKGYENSLIVVNTRKAAREVYKMIEGKKFHLSTYMTPKHRTRVIAEIRGCLSRGEKITVVSTSLIEVGVDLDFAGVFRELSGLDNLIQSAGRCNREGLRKDSVVYVFDTGKKLSKDVEKRRGITQWLLQEYEDVACAKSIEEYYKELTMYEREQIKDNSIAKDCIDGGEIQWKSIPFRTFAKKFEYIESETVNIIIPKGCEGYIQDLRKDKRGVLRKLQSYSVPVYHKELAELLSEGELEEVNGCYVLKNEDCYNEEFGLCTD